MRINHNIAALKTANKLNRNNKAMMTATERLSSGYKINKAADNPAGMAISRKMKTQIAALERAADNAADGVSVIQTAEGAITEIQSIVQRMRELAVQAANGTNTDEDRITIQAEISELKTEIDSISSKSEFNTKKLLDGSIDRKSYSDTNKINIITLSDDVRVDDYSFEVTKNPEQAKITAAEAMSTAAAPGGKLNINGMSVSIPTGATMVEAFELIREKAESANVTVTLVDAAGDPASINDPGVRLKFTAVEYGSLKTVDISGNTDTLKHFGLTNPSLKEYGKDVEISTENSIGFSATTTVRTEGDMVTIRDANGFSMQIRIDDDILVPGEPSMEVNFSLLEAGPMGLQIGASEGQRMEIRIPKISTETLGIEKLNLATREGASDAIAALDKALDQVSIIRAKLGAYQNRLEYTIANLDSANLNMQESLSRIEDTDMAAEMTKYTQYNVLVQAGTAMLSQANELPQHVLSLLQG